MDTLQDLFKEVYNDYVSMVYQVYEIFKDQFGEENVDLQDVFPIPELTEEVITQCEAFENMMSKRRLLKNFLIHYANDSCNIYIHWAHVRVTNEYDRFTELNDLWAQVNLRYNGSITGRFRLNRSNYSYLHISNGYMHSHVSNIPFSDFTRFQQPCTGSGPINNTINSLTGGFDRGLWQLFCCELNNYVTVESLSGVPYHRLESLGKSSNGGEDYENYRLITSLGYFSMSVFEKEDWQDFIREVITARKLKFAYANGAYVMGNSLAEATVIISDIFIKWFNRRHTDFLAVNLGKLLERGVLSKGIYQGGVIYGTGGDANRDFASYIGTKVLTFKGRDILLSIDGFSEADNFSHFLKAHIINFITTIILQVLNYRYGRETAKTAFCATHPSEEFI